MNNKTYKYSKALLIIAIIDLVLASIFFIMALFFGQILASYVGDEFGYVEGTLVFIGFVALVVIIIEVIAALKSKYSKGWTIYLIVVSVISLFFSLIRGNFFGLILPGLMFTFAILNLLDANNQSLSSNNNQLTSIELQLKELNNLYDKGFITNEEYQERRNRIINNI